MKCLQFNVLRWLGVITALLGFVAGCTTSTQPQQTPPLASSLPMEFPESTYRQAEIEGKKVLRITPEKSLITIEVRRAGTLARLGHDHVVASHNITGYVMPDEGRTDLFIPLAKLSVDEPDLRATAGFDTQPAAEAIEGTRHNMLTKVLEIDRFPYALIHAERIAPSLTRLRVAITLHGVTRTYEIPVQTESLPTGVHVRGDLSFTQSEFGIIPFSILGGAIQVQDRLDLHFQIIAHER